MTGIALGNLDVAKIALGNTEIVKVSLGDTLVWPNVQPPGNTEYVIITAPVTFVVPAGVTRIGVCMVGPGGSGANRTTAQGQVGGGGGGGGLVWASFDVTPGEEFDFSLGTGGTPSTMSTTATGVLMRGAGGSNAGAGTSTVGGNGGAGVITAAGTTFFATRNAITGTGTGGAGGNGSASVGDTAGGGGAGGYTGAGGAGASTNVTLNGADGSGGGGGGGACNTSGNSTRRGSRGGGTVLFGQASSGAGGVGGPSPTDGGFGSADGVPTTEEFVQGGSGGPAGFNQTIGIGGGGGAIAIRLNGADYPAYEPALTASTTYLPPLVAGQMPGAPEQPEQPIVPEDT